MNAAREREPGRREVALRQIVETAYDAFVGIDDEGVIIEWNPQAERTFGWERDEVLGRPLSDVLIPEQHRDQHRDGLRRFLDTGEQRVMYQRLRLPALHRSGEKIPVELTISPIELEDGYQFGAFLRDIREDLAAEEERYRREQLLAEAQRLARVGSWEWDIARDQVMWSPELYSIFGLDPTTALTYESYLLLLPEDERAAVQEHVATALERCEPFSFEHSVIRPDGQRVHIAARGRVVQDEEGRPIRMFGIAQDLSERLARERERSQLERQRVLAAHADALAEEARRSEVRYRQLADSIPQHVWTTDGEGQLEYMNSVGLAFFGADVARIAAARGEGFVHPDDLAPNLAAWERALAERVIYEARLRLRRHDGEYRWHLVRALPHTDARGAVLKWYGTSTDIHRQIEAESERDRALAELASANAELAAERTRLEAQSAELAAAALALEQSNRELDQFAYVASHDLRAPLRGIANLARFLEEDLADRLDDPAREQMRLLQARVARMDALITGILAYSRAGRVDLEAEPVDVRMLVEDLVSVLGPQNGTQVVIDPELPAIVAPRVPLEQVFQNLLSNAFKYVDHQEGRVEITARELEDRWEFTVADNGPGIAPEFQEQVWEIFRTLHSRDEVEGTGIGLAVVRKIVESAGGAVRLQSAEGAGARFSFEWPKETGGSET